MLVQTMALENDDKLKTGGVNYTSKRVLLHNELFYEKETLCNRAELLHLLFSSENLSFTYFAAIFKSNS